MDDFIALYPRDIQEKLQKIRGAVKKAAPKAEEAIKYGIPTFVLYGNLVSFAAYKNHIGFYPRPSGIEAFEKALSGYEGSKGTIKFPLDKPLPLTLIGRIVKYRVQKNREKVEARAKKKARK